MGMQPVKFIVRFKIYFFINNSKYRIVRYIVNEILQFWGRPSATFWAVLLNIKATNCDIVTDKKSTYASLNLF